MQNLQNDRYDRHWSPQRCGHMETNMFNKLHVPGCLVCGAVQRQPLMSSKEYIQASLEILTGDCLPQRLSSNPN